MGAREVVKLTPSQMERALEICRSQLAAVTKELEEEKLKLATAVEALECITRCNSNEFSDEPEEIASQALAAIRARKDKP
jgi:hypothetical protein